MAIRNCQGDKETKQSVAQILGFSPIEAGDDLTKKIACLYQRSWSKNSYRVQHVIWHVIPNDEIFLFDPKRISIGGWRPKYNVIFN